MPEFREVRARGDREVHRTYDGGAHPIAVCDIQMTDVAPDPRRWRGGGDRTLTECPACFAPEATDDEIKPGDLVVLDRSTGIPSNPRGWTPEQVYVYVGESAIGGERSTVLVEDGWHVVQNPERMPVASIPAGLDTPRMQAWNVNTSVLRHAPAGTDPDEVLVPRIRRARNRLLALRPEVVPSSGQVLLCEQSDASGHPNDPHTHTDGANPLWGDPNGRDSGHRLRHPDGTYVLFAKGPFAPTTTEREATPVPETVDAPALVEVGQELHPLTMQALRDHVPPGSVLTVRSRANGQERGRHVQFGCKSFEHTQLRDARATVTYLDSGAVQASADITTGTSTEYLTMAGQQISLGELSDYAASVIVKEVAQRVVDNAFVMEHGFYGCATHPGEIIFVGNGRVRGDTVPVVGKMHPVGTEDHRLTGTVGQTDGLTNVNFRDCTPIVSGTTATTMNLVSERRWALVPATEAQIARVRSMTRYRPVLGHTEHHTRLTECNHTGDPVEQPF